MAEVLDLELNRVHMEILRQQWGLPHRIVIQALPQKIHQRLPGQVGSLDRVLKYPPRVRQLLGLEQSQVQDTVRMAVNPEDKLGVAPRVIEERPLSALEQNQFRAGQNPIAQLGVERNP